SPPANKSLSSCTRMPVYSSSSCACAPTPTNSVVASAAIAAFLIHVAVLMAMPFVIAERTVLRLHRVPPQSLLLACYFLELSARDKCGKRNDIHDSTRSNRAALMNASAVRALCKRGIASDAVTHCDEISKCLGAFRSSAMPTTCAHIRCSNNTRAQ